MTSWEATLSNVRPPPAASSCKWLMLNRLPFQGELFRKIKGIFLLFPGTHLLPIHFHCPLSLSILPVFVSVIRESPAFTTARLGPSCPNVYTQETKNPIRILDQLATVSGFGKNRNPFSFSPPMSLHYVFKNSSISHLYLLHFLSDDASPVYFLKEALEEQENMEKLSAFSL